MPHTEVTRSHEVDFEATACALLSRIVNLRISQSPSLHVRVWLGDGTFKKFFPSDCYLRRRDDGKAHWIAIGIEEMSDGEDAFIAIEVCDIQQLACDLPDEP